MIDVACATSAQYFYSTFGASSPLLVVALATTKIDRKSGGFAVIDGFLIIAFI